MHKQLYAFLIPFVVLVILGFTPFPDLVFKGFKDEINIEKHKAYTYISYENTTIKILRQGFYKDLPIYTQVIHEKISKDENVTMHLLNYIYYINERSIAMVTNNEMNQLSENYDEEELISAVMLYDYLAQIEYRCILDNIGDTEVNLIDLYKSQGDVNAMMARVSYGMIKRFPEEKKKKAVRDLLSRTCSPTPVYKEQ